MLLSKCAVRDSKKLNFIKGKETSGLLRSLGKNSPLSKISFSWSSLVLDVLTS